MHVQVHVHMCEHAHPCTCVQALVNWERERHGTGAGCTTVQGFWMPGADAPLAPGGGPFAGGGALGWGTYGEEWARPRVSAHLGICVGKGGAVGKGGSVYWEQGIVRRGWARLRARVPTGEVQRGGR